MGIEDKGSFLVKYYENKEDLKEAMPQPDLEELPKFSMVFDNVDSYPSLTEEPIEFSGDDYDCFYDEHCIDEEDHRMLGYSNSIQGPMPEECELIYRCPNITSYKDIPDDVLEYARNEASNDWVLLLQIDTFFKYDFEFCLCDGGRLYYWIRKEDLKNKNFDNVWMILQCY